MTKYQLLIQKFRLWQKDPHCFDITPSEIELILDALETIQFLEIIFERKKKVMHKEVKK